MRTTSFYLKFDSHKTSEKSLFAVRFVLYLRFVYFTLTKVPWHTHTHGELERCAKWKVFYRVKFSEQIRITGKPESDNKIRLDSNLHCCYINECGFFIRWKSCLPSDIRADKRWWRKRGKAEDGNGGLLVMAVIVAAYLQEFIWRN